VKILKEINIVDQENMNASINFKEGKDYKIVNQKNLNDQVDFSLVNERKGS
jgi:hypothetical protein